METPSSSNLEGALDPLEAEIRSTVRVEDFDGAQALLRQYRDAIEQLVRSAAHPQSQCTSLGIRARALHAWVRQMAIMKRAKYLSQLDAVRTAGAYASPGESSQVRLEG